MVNALAKESSNGNFIGPQRIPLERRLGPATTKYANRRRNKKEVKIIIGLLTGYYLLCKHPSNIGRESENLKAIRQNRFVENLLELLRVRKCSPDKTMSSGRSRGNGSSLGEGTNSFRLK
ncbi:hypothetical protein Trydic_g4704 [Trypoxylus dichotomus]